MSIPVKLDDLDNALRDFDTAYLLSTGGEQIKVVCVNVRVDGDALIIATRSGGTARNLESNSTATLLCPPREARGMSLIIDGTAVADGDGFRFTPTGAILHRPAAHSDHPNSPDGCGHDCAPVE